MIMNINLHNENHFDIYTNSSEHVGIDMVYIFAKFHHVSSLRSWDFFLRGGGGGWLWDGAKSNAFLGS